MEWNGTYLGKIGTEDFALLDTIPGKFGTYWKIAYKDQEAFALVQQCNNMAPALLDNLKPFFGLYSTGTHVCRRSGALFVLYRAVWDDEGVLEDIPLSHVNFHLSPSCRCSWEISFALLFRWLFALRSSQGVLRLRTEHDYTYPISTNENIADTSQQLPLTVTSWIGKDPSIVCRDWIGIYSTDQYHKWIAEFISHFEHCEKQLCRNDSFRWLLDIFCARLYDLVVFAFDE